MKKFQATFTPKDSTINAFKHEIEAIDAKDAYDFFNCLASVWAGKFENIEEIV